MKKTLVWLGIAGVALFVLTTIVSSLYHHGYSHTAQFISELYADGAPNADRIRYYGYLPSGVLLFLFSMAAIFDKPRSWAKTIGFLGIGIGYGLGTVICSIFNCDAGCNPELIDPSLSQIIHNLTGLLTYLIVPVSILIVALAYTKNSENDRFGLYSILLSVVSFMMVILLNLSLQSDYKGLIQRLIEGCILCWIVMYSAQASKSQKSV